MLLFGSIWYTTAHKVKENNEVGAGETLLKVGHGNECVCECVCVCTIIVYIDAIVFLCEKVVETKVMEDGL